MENYKKFNECKVGDMLYCIDYTNYHIVPLTIEEIVTDGPHIERNIYSKEAIVIKEKVPNSSEEPYIVDNYYRGDKCESASFGVFTTYKECKEAIIHILNREIKNTEDDIEKSNYSLIKLKETLKDLQNKAMTRKEEITNAAKNYASHFPPEYINERTYIEGAEWADRSMIEKALNYFAPYIQDNSGGYEREEILNGFKKLFKS